MRAIRARCVHQSLMVVVSNSSGVIFLALDAESSRSSGGGGSLVGVAVVMVGKNGDGPL